MYYYITGTLNLGFNPYMYLMLDEQHVLHTSNKTLIHFFIHRETWAKADLHSRDEPHRAVSVRVTTPESVQLFRAFHVFHSRIRIKRRDFQSSVISKEHLWPTSTLTELLNLNGKHEYSDYTSQIWPSETEAVEPWASITPSVTQSCPRRGTSSSRRFRSG